MSAGRYGRQDIFRTKEVSFDAGDLDFADFDEGLVVKEKYPNTAWQAGQAKVEKTSADTDIVAGVLLNSPLTNLGSSTVPTLDANATLPGGRVANICTIGTVLVKTDAAVTNTMAGQYLIPSGTTDGQATAGAYDSAKGTFARIIAATPNPQNLVLAELFVPLYVG